MTPARLAFLIETRCGFAGRVAPLCFLLLVLLAERGRTAGATVFATKASFLAATGALNFESFEGLAVTNTVGTVETLVLPGFTMTHSGPTTLAFDTLTTFNIPQEGQAPTAGSKWVYARQDSGTASGGNLESILVTFGSPIRAFGFAMTDALDVGTGPNEFLLTTNGGDAATALSGLQANANLAFFGIVTMTPFTQVTLVDRKSQDGFGLDEFYFGTPVPEPGTAVLALLAFGCLRRMVL